MIDPVVAAAPVNTVLPTVSGTTTDGHTLSTSTGAWSGTPTITYTRQWRRCDGAGSNCIDIDGATGAAYTLAPADVGATLRLAVAATNAAGELSATSAATATVAAASPLNTALPNVSGITTGGQTLSSTAGSWTGTPTITYDRQWRRCDSAGNNCVDINGATRAAYTLARADVGATIRVVVTAANAAPGTVSATSEQTAGVAATVPAATFITASGAQASSVSWGSDVGGALGTGYASFTPARTPVGALPSGLQPDGTALVRGMGQQGEMGDGTLLRRLIPVTVPGLTNVVQIASAGAHRMALLSNGTVVTWGSNLSGELGIGTYALPHGEGCLTNCYSTVPIPVPGLAGVTAVFAGGADDAALLSNGTVVAWGENLKGQLGDGTKVEKDSPTLINGLSNVRTLTMGGSFTLGGHTLALLNDGTVKAWGFNGEGQLGIGSSVGSLLPAKVSGLSGVTAIAASWTHSLALAGGKLYAWGNNSNGELGFATTTLCAKKSCSTVPVQVPLEGVSSIAAGYAFSVTAAGGRAYAWGKNRYGQLGDGTTLDHGAPGLVSGLTGVLTVRAGNIAAGATISGAAPPPVIQAVPGSGSLTVTWKGSGGTRWDVRSRVASCCLRSTPPFGPITKLPAEARSYTLHGTPGVRYEVSVAQVDGVNGRDVVEGTPLP